MKLLKQNWLINNAHVAKETVADYKKSLKTVVDYKKSL